MLQDGTGERDPLFCPENFDNQFNMRLQSGQPMIGNTAQQKTGWAGIKKGITKAESDTQFAFLNGADNTLGTFLGEIRDNIANSCWISNFTSPRIPTHKFHPPFQALP